MYVRMSDYVCMYNSAALLRLHIMAVITATYRLNQKLTQDNVVSKLTYHDDKAHDNYNNHTKVWSVKFSWWFAQAK